MGNKHSVGLYERLAWPLLLHVDAERAHRLVLGGARAVQHVPPALAALWSVNRSADALGFTWKGLRFKNPIGLAAGLDKDAAAPRTFEALGLGFVEVGTVTPRPQPGNPRPRIHRLPGRRAMINSMGFPGEGVEAMVRRLARTPPLGVPLGINIGKNAATPLDEAPADYLACLDALYAFGSYFVVNVSSPNTQGLTSLQARPALEAILRPLAKRREALSPASTRPAPPEGERRREASGTLSPASTQPAPPEGERRREASGTLSPASTQPAPPEGESHKETLKPLLVKVSPDLSMADLDAALEGALAAGVDGIIATNTTADPAVKGDAAHLPGGLSGAPLRPKSLAAVQHIRTSAPSGFLVIGAGGIFSADDALALLDAGADAVQLYTGLVYRGPGLVAEIKRSLVRAGWRGRPGSRD